MTPLVSVIIPTYNSSELLDKAVESIVKQTYPNIELIIVDDFSTNGLREKLHLLAKQISCRLIFLKQNSGSASKPLNEGLKAAKGKYISVCGHDDYYFPTKIAQQVAVLERNPQYKITYAKMTTHQQGDKYSKKPKFLPCPSGYIFKSLFLQRSYIPALTVMINREVFETVGTFDENLIIEDWDMWLRIAYQFPVYFIDEFLACYQLHETNISKVQSERMRTDRKKIIDKWKHLSLHHAAHTVNRLIDGDSAQQFSRLIKDTWLAFIYTKQPYRVLRLFAANIRRRWLR